MNDIKLFAMLAFPDLVNTFWSVTISFLLIIFLLKTKHFYIATCLI